MPKEKILVVDDEEDILELIRHNLAREGYRIVCAATGESALTKSNNEKPDLIVLDLMLPGIDGLQVARRLKNDVRTKKSTSSPSRRCGPTPMKRPFSSTSI